MLIVVDVGNSHTVVGAYQGTQLLEHWRLETHRGRTTDELGILLLQLFEVSQIDPARVDGAIISCVMPSVLQTTQDTLARYFDVEALIVGPGIRTQMPILYENPREVGADRIVNAVAAYDRYRQGLIVVDFGTATTFDVISVKGEYLGGVIAPGIGIASEALFDHASKLPRVELKWPERVVGRNTVASMQSGILYGFVGLVEEIARRIQGELKFDTVCIATGTLADVIAREAHIIQAVHSDLTLEGLRILYERNVRRARE